MKIIKKNKKFLVINEGDDNPIKINETRLKINDYYS